MNTGKEAGTPFSAATRTLSMLMASLMIVTGTGATGLLEAMAFSEEPEVYAEEVYTEEASVEEFAEAAPVTEVEPEEAAAPVTEAEPEEAAAPAAEAEPEEAEMPAAEAVPEEAAAPVTEAVPEEEEAPVTEAEPEEAEEFVGEPSVTEDEAAGEAEPAAEESEEAAAGPDWSADVEDEADWTAGLPELTGDYGADIAAIAESQVGYGESVLNYVEDGGSYTRYGDFCGDPYADPWDAEFAAFCLYYADVPDFDYDTDSDRWLAELTRAEKFLDADYDARPGDRIVLDEDGQTRLGIVVKVKDETVSYVAATIGETRDAVVLEKIDRSSDAIRGYCPAPVAEEVPAGDEYVTEYNEYETAGAIEVVADDENELERQTITARIGAEPVVAPKRNMLKGAAMPAAVKSATEKETDAATGNGISVTLTGLLPVGASVVAEPVEVTVEGQKVLAAYDITIYDADGAVWQPGEVVTVAMNDPALRAAAGSSLSVFHMADAAAEPELVAMVEAGSSGVAFDAASFSIYVVAEDALTKTYTFYNGTAVYSKQELQNGQILAQPPAPTKDGAVFQHWSLTVGGPEFTGFGTAATINDTTDNSEVSLYAVYGDETIYVTYYGQDGEVYRRDSYTRPTGSDTLPVDTTAVEYSAGQRDDGTFMKFLYWTEGQLNLAESEPPHVGYVEGDETTRENNTITLNKDSGNIDLYPVISEGHWIYFDTNKSALGDDDANVSYVAPVFVVNGDSVAHNFTAGVPTTAGYTFDGWYTRRSGGNMIFDAAGEKQTAYSDLLDHNGNLANNPTVYAHWTMNTSADYTIIIWKQKVTDRAGIANDAKKYDYEESTTLSGTPGNTVSVQSTDTNKGYAGFHLNSAKTETSKTLAPDGSTVLNVYYDRNEITINFYLYGYTYTVSNNDNDNNPAKYGDVDGQKARVYWNNGAFRTSNSWNGAIYNGTIYTRNNSQSWHIDRTFIGLDNQTFEQAGYTWPTDYWWYDNGNYNGTTSGSRTTFLAGFILTNGGTSKNFYGNAAASGANTNITFYQQELNEDGTAATTYKVADDPEVSIGGSFSISDKYAGFKAVRYTNDANSGGVTLPEEPNIQIGNDKYYATDVSTTNLNIYFNRIAKSIEFRKNDGTNAVYANQSNVPYESPLSKWLPANPTRVGYTFTGWYYDEGQKAPVEADDTMPATNLLLYAGWEKVSYNVDIEANGGEIGAPNNNHATYFMVYFDETVDEYSNVLRNYVKVGPPTTGDTRPHYSYHEYRRDGHYVNGGKVDDTTADPVTNSRSAKYVEDAEGIYVYEEGAYTLQGWYKVTGGTMSSTPFNFNDLLTGDTTLRAKWRRTSYYTVVYEANADGVTGMRAPNDHNRYIEGASAIVEASIGAPAGKHFVGWKDKNGAVYSPNATLAITEDKAVELADHSMQITLTAVYADSTLPDGYMADYVFMVDDEQYYKQTIAAGETLVSPVNPTEAGKIFDGWYYDQQGKHRFDGFGVVNNPVYTTLYAHFTNVYTVTYYTADEAGTGKGDVIITAQNYRPGEKLNTLYIDSPTDDEHMVAHWTDGTTTYPYNSPTNTAVNSNLTLWAVLTEQKYIRFNLQDGKTADGGEYMDPIRIPAQGWPALPAEPVRAGYAFEGWFTEPNGEGVEYEFNKEVSTFMSDNHLTGELNLFAKWVLNTANPVQAKLNVLWYAQLAAGPDGGYGDDNYELVGNGSIMMNLGSYDLSNAATKATLDAEFGDIYNTDRLEMLYTGTAPRYAQAKLPNYFEHSTHHDLTFSVDDSGESVLKIYFDRKVYYYKFNLNKKGSTDISSFGNEIHKGNTGTVYTGSSYVLPIWLDKYVYPEWPIEEAARESTTDEYWVEFDKNGSTTDHFYGWYNTTSAKNYMTALYSIPSDRIDEFVNPSVSNKTIELTVYTTSNKNEVVLQYWFDGIHEGKYDQSLYVGNSTNSYNGKTFDYYFRAKDFDGYEIINQNNKRSDENDYCYNTGSADRGEIKTTSSSTTQENRIIYQYYRSSEWAGTTFYNTLKPVYSTLDLLHLLPIGYELEDPITILFHGNRSTDDSELEAGWTDKVNDYQITVGGSPKTSGSVYYYDSNHQIQTLNWNQFVNEVIAFRTKTATHTVPVAATTINYYYRAKSYTVTLMGYDGTPLGITKTVKYTAPVTGENGVLSASDIPTPDTGRQFKCWSLSANSKEPFSGTMPAHNLVLYAQDEPVPVTVTFNKCYFDEDSGKFVYDENTTQNSYTVTKDYNTELRDFVPEKPVQENAVFEGWVDENGSPIPANTKVPADMTVYPSFSSFKQYKVIYEVNGGTGTAPEDVSKYVEGAEIVAKAGTGLTKAFTDVDGVSHNGPFTHWNTKADGSGRSYFPGDVIVLGEDAAADEEGVATLTLYAQYNKYRETTLIYDKNTTDTGAVLRAKNDGETIAKETNGTVVIRFKDHTQEQTTGGGIPNTKVTIGRDQNGIEFEAYRPGYRFLGWARTSGATEPEAQNGDSAYVNTLTDGGNTLYAVWERAGAYLKLENVSASKNLTFRLTVNSGDYAEALWQKDNSAVISKATGKDYYEITVNHGESNVLYLPKAAGLTYSLEVVYKGAVVSTLSDQRLRWQTGKDVATGTLVEGTYAANQTDVRTNFTALNYDLKQYIYAVVEDSDVKLTVTNTVAGPMGEPDRDFRYELSGLTDGTTVTGKKYASASDTTGDDYTETVDDGKLTFTLKHGERIELNVPAGATLTLTETAATGYETWMKTGTEAYGTTKPDTMANSRLDLGALTEDTTVQVLNWLGDIAPTGVRIVVGPFLAILAAGVLMLTVSRRKRDDEAEAEDVR